MLQWSVRGQGLTAEHVGENGSRSAETVSVSHSVRSFCCKEGKEMGESTHRESRGKKRLIIFKKGETGHLCGSVG